MIDVDKCGITRYPAPVLAEPAKRVDEINDNIRLLADKMLDIMVETKGVGLAGPQAGVPLRIFVVSVDGTKENGKVYINPTIEPSGELEPSEEGCLSLPGIYTKVRRYSRCKIKATGLDGKEFTEEATGLLARAFQHENDHLEGRLIVDRIGQVAKIAIRGRLKELREIYEKNIKR
jgi:peptide deformylase